MIDQLIVGSKGSYDDFDASLKEREIEAPKKKTIKETVPYFNGSYDFSAINGEVYWEDRVLKYIFEIIAPTPEKLECKKRVFSDWVMNVMDQPIYDPFEPGWHYKGTFEEIEYSDDESLEKTTITVTFSAYPYKIADNMTTYNIVVPANSQKQVNVINGSSHRIIPTLIADAGMRVAVGVITYTLSEGKYADSRLMLNPGSTVFTVINDGSSDCTLDVQFYEEVF